MIHTRDLTAPERRQQFQPEPPRASGRYVLIGWLRFVVAVLCTTLTLTATAGGAEPVQVNLLRTPGGGIQPQAIVDGQGTLHLIYFQGDPAAGDLFYVRRLAGERDFEPPLRVNSHPNSAIAVGTIRGGQLAIGKQNRPHVVWNGSRDAQPRGTNQKNDTPMLYSRLNDAGTAFENQRNLIHEAYGLDGGGSVAADANGNVYVAWHGNPAADGEQNRRVYLAVSRDEGETFASETTVSDASTGVCGCCGMKAFCDSSGRLLMLYRSATREVNRDMILLVSNDQGRSFTSEVIAKWQVGTCPMSSAVLAESPRGVVAGWETAGQVFFGQIPASSAELNGRLRPAGASSQRKHPAVAVNHRGETLLVWTEGTGWNRGGAVAWQLLEDDGSPTTTRGRREGLPTWSLATVVAETDGTFTVIY